MQWQGLSGRNIFAPPPKSAKNPKKAKKIQRERRNENLKLGGVPHPPPVPGGGSGPLSRWGGGSGREILKSPPPL